MAATAVIMVNDVPVLVHSTELKVRKALAKLETQRQTCNAREICDMYGAPTPTPGPVRLRVHWFFNPIHTGKVVTS